MKKTYFLFSIFIFTFLANSNIYSQLMNASFEDWNDLGPNFWTTSNVPGYFVGITKSSDAHSGSSSAKIELISYLNFPYPSSLTSINDDNSYGHPVSAKYTSLTGYLKSDFKSSGIMVISVYMADENDNYLGFGGISVNKDYSSWTEFNIPIEYALDSTPKNCYVQFLISDSADTPDANSIGSYVLVDDLSLGNITSVETNEKISDDFLLYQNYPNPFNPSTIVSFSNPEKSKIKIEIYNAIGQFIKVLSNKEYNSGKHELMWNAENLPSGVYFVRIEAKSAESSRTFLNIKKAILMR